MLAFSIAPHTKAKFHSYQNHNNIRSSGKLDLPAMD
jgi:hypothetical protein